MAHRTSGIFLHSLRCVKGQGPTSDGRTNGRPEHKMTISCCEKDPGMFRTRFFVVTGVILAAALARLVPHPPNFAPIGAMALLAGACFADRRLASAVPLAAMFLSDL